MEADFVIIGAGSAGCVLANRLSAEPGTSVLLLEAGPPNSDLSLKIPAAMATNLQRTKHNWAFQGEPEPGLGGRQIQHDRGKTLGGSSSINGMVFIRGHARDYDVWRQMGCAGWGYADVLPYFRRMEDYSAGEDDYRGKGGPLHVQRPQEDALHPLSRAFLEAGREAGYPTTGDISGQCQEGFGVLDRTTYRGERWSTAKAYLEPVRARPNLRVETGVHVRRVILDGSVATGVEIVTAAGETVTVRAHREVILSAGAVGSPHLLMLSGLGPADHLQDMGIEPVRDLPGVGANLNEHPDFLVKFHLKQPISLWPTTKGLRQIAAGMQWLVARNGVCATNHFETVACLRSNAGVDYPDIQLTMVPVAMAAHGWDALPMHAFQIHIGLMRAQSRGRITLRDKNPASPPRILVNYLDDPRDLEVMRAGVRLVRELVEQPAFRPLAGDEFYPGPEIRTDAQLDQALRDGIETQWHLSGTARMGSETDAMAVVDPAGRVRGVERLRVVDASIMPQVTNGNTNSPTIMMAEKLSDAILERAPLPRLDLPVWQNPNWETAQR